MALRNTVIRKGQPTPGDVHINAPLTNISVAFLQSQDVFVADRVFPVVPVNNQSDVYFTFSREDFLRDEAKQRAPGTESAGGGFGVSTAPYACTVEAFHKDVDDQLRANADSVLQLDRAATEFAMQKLLIRRERRWVNSFFKTGVWGTDITPTTLWSAAGSDPAKDLEAGKLSILGYAGFKANTLVVGAQVMSALRYNQAIRDQFKYTSSESLDDVMIARYFNVDRVLVMNSIYVGSNEGAAITTNFIGGKHALLCYTTSAPALMTPTAGYTFAWSGFTGSSNGIRTKKMRAELLASDRIEAEMAYDMRVVTPGMGYFLANVVA